MTALLIRCLTIVAVVATALAVPISQLRTVQEIKSCCCPDPNKCHCPKDKKHDDRYPSINVCHDTSRVVIAPESPAFDAPATHESSLVELVTPGPMLMIEMPHPAPAPQRPDAPS